MVLLLLALAPVTLSIQQAWDTLGKFCTVLGALMITAAVHFMGSLYLRYMLYWSFVVAANSKIFPALSFLPPRPPDEDPHGAKLAATEDPLGEATKLVEKLKSHCSHHLLTQLAAFEVYSRRGKLLLALSAVQRGVEIAGSQDPEVAVRLVRLALQGKDGLEETVLQWGRKAWLVDVASGHV